MGELKDRDVPANPKKESKVISIRVPSEENERIRHEAAKKGITVSEHLRESARSASRNHPLQTGYSCDSCKRKIQMDELYYCELINRERFVNGENPTEPEIDVLDSDPIKILCEPCARKKRKLAQFDEPRSKGACVGKSERDQK